MYCATIESPLGALLLAWTESGLTRVSFLEGSKAIEPDSGWTPAPDPAFGARRQLDSYFAGDLNQFDLPLAPCGTAFQQHVWRELARIPFARTASYGEIARRVGRPKASRAVGAANGNNPLPIIVPCHRVVGSDGSLTGYSGGVEIKEFLLAHEARCAAR
ncbi:MAG: methylated-DNA--[protein]-cysteine S-methyltransferase [Gemmatimonadetes bacterium]|nr:methylated-DNA--[protein]-cysteine S-methyltransferase [Gemmatimonadota bacterium]